VSWEGSFLDRRNTTGVLTEVLVWRMSKPCASRGNVFSASPNYGIARRWVIFSGLYPKQRLKLNPDRESDSIQQ
jgi:hypothetical protein